MPSPNPTPNHQLDLPQFLESFSRASLRPEVRDLLGAGRYAVVAGRNSGDAGRDPVAAAVQSLESAVESLARQGVDYRPYVPPTHELLRRLSEDGRTTTSTAPDGTTFRNTFLEIDLSPVPVLLLLSTGSARKLDENCVQPFSKYAAELVRSTGAALLYAARVDRITRHRWAIADVMMALEQVGGYLGDERGLFADPAGGEAFQLFADASAAQSVADLLPGQSRQGQKDHTDERMVDGRCRYGVGSFPPAGLARCRMKRGTSGGDSEIFLEMPGVLPGPAEVSYGLPEVFDEDGRHVDQVANVVWALSVWKTDAWTDAAVEDELARRRFSTAGLRGQRRDPKAHWTVNDASKTTMLDAIEDRLEFYESGRLECRSSKFEPIIVEGVFPPEGQWASPADFARIRDRLVAGSDAHSRRAKRTFAGMHVTVNGVRARMYHREGTRYRTQAHSTGCVVPGRIVLTHEQLAAALVEAIAAAGDAAVQLVPIVDDRHDDELRTMASQRRPLEMEVLALDGRLNALGARLEEVGPDGTPALTGALLAKVNQDFNTLNEEANKKSQLIADLDRRADVRRAELRADASIARVDRLLHMVASLCDPSDLTFRDTWRSAVRDLVVECTEVREHGHTGQQYTLQGWLQVGNQGDEHGYRLPLHATWRRGPITEISDRVADIVTGMRNGIPYCGSRVPGAEYLRSPLTDHLGPMGPLLAACDDGRLIRIAMAVTVDRSGRTVEDVATQLEEPLALVTRLTERFAKPSVRGRWYVGGSALAAAMYDLAASSDGVVRWDDLVPAFARTRAVVHSFTSDPSRRGMWKARRNVGLELAGRCGCDLMAPPVFAEMTIAEPDGPVCRRCWTDRSGVAWPETAYGRFVLERDDPRPRRRVRRRR